MRCLPNTPSMVECVGPVLRQIGRTVSQFDRFRELVAKARDLEAELDRNLLLQGVVALLGLLYVTNSPLAGELADTIGITDELIQIGTPVVSAVLFLRMGYVLIVYFQVRKVLANELKGVARKSRRKRDVAESLETGSSPFSLFLYFQRKDSKQSGALSTSWPNQIVSFVADFVRKRWKSADSSYPIPVRVAYVVVPLITYALTFMLAVAPVLVNMVLSIYFAYELLPPFWGWVVGLALATGFTMFYLAFGGAASKVLEPVAAFLLVAVGALIGVLTAVGLMLWDPLPSEVSADPNGQTPTPIATDVRTVTPTDSGVPSVVPTMTEDLATSTPPDPTKLPPVGGR